MSLKSYVAMLVDDYGFGEYHDAQTIMYRNEERPPELQLEYGECYARTYFYRWVAMWIVGELRNPLARLWCRLFHHDLIDDGYGTPDRGCIHVYCRRCGRDYGTQRLY